MNLLQHDQLYLQARRHGAHQTSAALVWCKTQVLFALGDLMRASVRFFIGRLVT